MYQTPQTSSEKIEVSEKEKLRYIKKSIYCVDFKNADLKIGISNMLHERFNESKKSFLLLYKENLQYDATLIAGYMIELLVQIFNVEKNIISIDRILGKTVYEHILMLLKLPEGYNNNWEKSFKQDIDQLEQYADSVFNKPDEVFGILKNNTTTRIEKLKKLVNKRRLFKEENTIHQQIFNFSEDVKQVLKNFKINFEDLPWLIDVVYQFYCCHKHSNFLSFSDLNIDLVTPVFILSILDYYTFFHELDSLQAKYEQL